MRFRHFLFVLLLVLPTTAESPDEKANALFDQAYQASVERSPMALSQQGSRKFYDRWDDFSREELVANLELTQSWLSKIEAEVELNDLSEQGKLSLFLFTYNAQMEADGAPYLEYDYPVNQLSGLQARIPVFLINGHQVANAWDAECYIGRINRMPALFQQITDGLQRREKNGVLPPKFVLAQVLENIDQLLTGYPLQKVDQQHPLYEDFTTKVKALKLPQTQEDELLDKAKKAIREGFQPAYVSLRSTIADQQTRATEDAGVWKFPSGDDYYAYTLRQTTTTDMTPDELHQLGLSEVARLKKEIEALLPQLKFDGELAAFFEHMRTNTDFNYPNTDEGRDAYLARSKQIVDEMKVKLDTLFITEPTAQLVVKRVEPFREKTAGKAFYQSAAADGSRPGIYYNNLYDMTTMPSYQMEALTHHEAIPGHHMQLSIAQELQDMPLFRKNRGYISYVEGWAVYCEKMTKEIGFYQDPYSDFGRLASELWRSCRLVVDTGIHHKRWTREQAVQYYKDNTPNNVSACEKMVDRHIVMPAQAVSYKVGMNEFLRLRDDAKDQLGDRFDIREFHEAVITKGAVPLTKLDELVDLYIQEQSSSE